MTERKACIRDGTPNHKVFAAEYKRLDVPCSACAKVSGAIQESMADYIKV